MRKPSIPLLTLFLIVFAFAFRSDPVAEARACRAAGWTSGGSQTGYPTPAGAIYAAAELYRQYANLPAPMAVGDIHVQGRWAFVIAYGQDASGQGIPYEFAGILAYRDPETGWYALAPGASPAREYNTLLAAFPTSLLDGPAKAYLHQPDPHAAMANLTGHRLPWPSGEAAYVTKKDGSGHESQVDFDIHGWSGSGDVFASKPGTVVFVKESSNAGCCAYECWRQTNMVVVQHASDEYSWYVHLAHDSVPVSVGQQVGFGTKIGVEGNTGYSCGIHLHYMASADHYAWTDPEDPNAAPWGYGITRVDFDEVPWSGLTVGQSYTSQNVAGAGECPQSEGVILYWNSNYDCTNGAGDTGYRQRTMPGFENTADTFNDRASSLRIPTGWSVRLFEHVDGGGDSVCRSEDDPDFTGDYFDGGSVPLNDNVSSIEVFDIPVCDYGPGPQNWYGGYREGQACWDDPYCSMTAACEDRILGPKVHQNWGPGNPCDALEADEWVGDFRARIHFDAGEYAFHLASDEGAILWLDGEMIGRLDSGGSGPICAGDHGFALDGDADLRLLSRHHAGNAHLHLSWDTDTSVCHGQPVYLGFTSPLTREVEVEMVVTEAGDPEKCLDHQVLATDMAGGHPGVQLGDQVKTGTYDLFFKPVTYLRQQQTRVSLTEGETTVVALDELIAGDTSWDEKPLGDNRINYLDLENVVQSYGTSDPGTDLNGDGVVDFNDLAIAAYSLGGLGDGWTDVSPCNAGPSARPTGVEKATAAATASITLTPTHGTFAVGEALDVEVQMDTDGQDAAGVDLIVRYDPGVLEVRDADPSTPGLQILPENAFDNALQNRVDPALGEIHYSANNEDGTPFDGTGLLATIPFTVVTSIDDTGVSVYYGDGWTADTNVVGSGTAQDVLAVAGRASFRTTGSPSRPMPSLTLLPGSGAQVNAQLVELQALATDSFSQVREVGFETRGYSDWTAVATDTLGANGWMVPWELATLPDGVYDLRASALIPGGSGTTVTNTGILLDRTPPGFVSATFTPTLAPSPGTPVVIAAAASDEGSGVKHIDVYANSATDGSADGSWDLLGSIAGDRGSIVWGTAGYAPGVHQIAFDIRDQAGNIGPGAQLRLFFEIWRDYHAVYVPLIARNVSR